MAIFWIGGIPQPYRVDAPKFQKGVERVKRTIRTKDIKPGSNVGSQTQQRVSLYEEPAPGRQPAILSEQLMSNRIFAMAPEDSTDSARRLFLAQKIHHVPVVDERDKLVGIVSDRDLMKAQIREQEGEVLQLSDIMTRRVLAAGKDTPIREIAGTMYREHIHAMPIVDDMGRLIGLITASDILGCLVNNAPLDLWI